jgi:hypothetical protein
MADYLDHTRIAQKLLDQQGEINDLTAERDAAYRERAHLIALLATHYPAVITTADDVDEEGWQIAFLTIGGHQATWHISPRDADLFGHVDITDSADPEAQWDGHSTEEKYERIRQLTNDDWLIDHAASEGIDTTGCDCGHDGMGLGWHVSCAWKEQAISEALWSSTPAADEGPRECRQPGHTCSACGNCVYTHPGEGGCTDDPEPAPGSPLRELVAEAVAKADGLRYEHLSERDRMYPRKVADAVMAVVQPLMDEHREAHEIETENTAREIHRAEQDKAALDRVRDAAALHRKQLLSTAELHAVIEATTNQQETDHEPDHRTPHPGRAPQAHPAHGDPAP